MREAVRQLRLRFWGWLAGTALLRCAKAALDGDDVHEARHCLAGIGTSESLLCGPDCPLRHGPEDAGDLAGPFAAPRAGRRKLTFPCHDCAAEPGDPHKEWCRVARDTGAPTARANGEGSS